MVRYIYLVRHGETDYNKRKIIQGAGIDSDLNAKGIKQAELFYNKYFDVAFQHIFASSLKRTLQTIQPFIADNCVQPIITKSLDEVNWGIYEGKKGNPHLKKKHDELMEAWANGDYDAKIPEGESPNQVVKRQKDFVEQLKTLDFDNILVCCHGRAIRILLCTLLNVPLSRMNEFTHSNTALYLIKYDGNQYEVIKKSDISHLDA